MKNKTERISTWAIAALLVLLVPLVAMQFTDQVHWNTFDFLVAFVLFFSAGLAYEFAIAKVRHTGHRVLAAVIIAATLALIWAELAVGVFGTPWAGS